MIPDFVEFYKGYWLLKNDQSISKMVKYNGRLGYDPIFNKLKELNSMPRNSLCIDVGAFIGDTTSIFLNKGHNVIAFEPQEDAYTCLQHNCPGSLNWKSPLGDGRKVNLSNSKVTNMGNRPVIDGGTIETLKLDNVTPKSAKAIFLKIDAEGFEPAILEGAKELLANPALKHIVIEFNPSALSTFGYTCDDIMKYLTNWSYREIFRYYDQNWDCVFSRC